MLKLIKGISLPALFCFSTFVLANEIEVNMENVLEVGRENQTLSATSQNNIDQTERQTDKIVNEYKVVSKQVEGLKLYNAQKRIQIQAQLDLMDKLDEQLVQVVGIYVFELHLVLLKRQLNLCWLTFKLQASITPPLPGSVLLAACLLYKSLAHASSVVASNSVLDFELLRSPRIR